MARAYDEHFVSAQDGTKIYYRDYAGQDETATPILCLAGLTRNCRDFDDMIGALNTPRRIIAADMRGRGRSDYAKDFHSYDVPTEIADVLTVLGDAGINKVIVIGTSRGGLLAMTLAALRPDRLQAVVLNDIGPQLELEGLARISAYVGKMAPPESWQQAIDAIRQLNGPLFPDFSDEDWNRFARQMLKDVDGKPAYDYDAAIGDALAAQAQSGELADLWPLFAAMQNIPVLVVRGAKSDILSAEGVAKMHDAKSDMQSVEVPLRGHAPTLAEPAAVEALEAFLTNVA